MPWARLPPKIASRLSRLVAIRIGAATGERLTSSVTLPRPREGGHRVAVAHASTSTGTGPARPRSRA
jgi:hypothetical protein